jgi:hypothetical protein
VSRFDELGQNLIAAVRMQGQPSLELLQQVLRLCGVLTVRRQGLDKLLLATDMSFTLGYVLLCSH